MEYGEPVSPVTGSTHDFAQGEKDFAVEDESHNQKK
jgi:hypothetical protein